MYFIKTLIVLAATAAMVSAIPGMKRDEPVRRFDCGHLGDCYSNGCSPSFPAPDATVGTCTQGQFNGCDCAKCGGTTGTFTGPCDDNGCRGIIGICTAGNYRGCKCN